VKPARASRKRSRSPTRSVYAFSRISVRAALGIRDALFTGGGMDQRLGRPYTRLMIRSISWVRLEE
jgi:hypothetical protein